MPVAGAGFGSTAPPAFVACTEAMPEVLVPLPVTLIMKGLGVLVSLWVKLTVAFFWPIEVGSKAIVNEVELPGVTGVVMVVVFSTNSPGLAPPSTGVPTVRSLVPVLLITMVSGAVGPALTSWLPKLRPPEAAALCATDGPPAPSVTFTVGPGEVPLPSTGT